LRAQLSAALPGDETYVWVVEPIETVSGRTIAELVLAGDRRELKRFLAD
jgi:hypothetical protein